MRARIGLYLGPLLAILLWILPMGLPPSQQRLMGLMLWVVVWWICETLPLAATAFLGAAGGVLLGIAEEKAAFAPFAHPLIFLFMGGFFLARAMRVHSLDRRFALYILTRPLVRHKPLRAVPALYAVTAFTAMWISNTATAAMMLPIALGVLAAIFPKEEPGQDAALIASGYAASIGGIATPVGSTPNIIAIANLSERAGTYLTFPEWVVFALPIMILTLVACSLLARTLLPQAPHTADTTALQKQLKELGPLSLGEKNTLFALSLTVFFWVMPGVVALFIGKDHALILWLRAHLPEATVAMLGSCLLFLLPDQVRRPTLTWKEAVKIDWSALMLFGGGLSLGAMMFDTGLAGLIGEYLISVTGGHFWLFMIVMVFFTIFFTETTSNTATANVLVPLVIAACQKLNVEPVLPTVGVAIACSLAFMMPVSTPPNAIFYGSGMVRITRMAKMGFVLNLISGVIILTVLYLYSLL